MRCRRSSRTAQNRLVGEAFQQQRDDDKANDLREENPEIEAKDSRLFRAPCRLICRRREMSCHELKCRPVQTQPRAIYCLSGRGRERRTRSLPSKAIARIACTRIGRGGARIAPNRGGRAHADQANADAAPRAARPT